MQSIDNKNIKQFRIIITIAITVSFYNSLGYLNE